MSFQWPVMLWLLLAVPLLVGAHVWSLRRKARHALRFSAIAPLREALGARQRIRRHLPAGLLVVGMGLLLFAVARPSAVIPSLSNKQTVVLAIDVSLSMRATDVDPNRISAAQAAARAFFEDLPDAVRVGIVSFAGTASVVQPPTNNREELIAAVDRLQLQRHTATGSGLLVSLATLLPEAGIDLESLLFGPVRTRERASTPPAQSVAKPKPAQLAPVPPGSYGSGAIVLLSDGRRTMGIDAIAAARMAAERGVKVFTVGFGTTEGGPVDFGGWSMYMKLDEETLKQIADVTRAEYFRAENAAELKKVYQQLTSRLGVERKETELGALLAILGGTFVSIAAVLSQLWFNRMR